MGNVAKLPIVEKKLITIEKGVPMPARPRPHGRPRKYPWPEMEVGDSFVIAGGVRTAGGKVSAASRRYNRKFATRAVVENGVKVVRVWRVE